MHLTAERWDAAHDLFDEMVDEFGAGRFHDDPPELVLVWDPRGWGRGRRRPPPFGSYPPVMVNFARCRCWREVVGTMLHEYRHHLQDPEWTDEWAYEADAEAFAEVFLHHYWKLGDRAP